MSRNIDAFILNMLWVEEEETERKTKKGVVTNKAEARDKINNLLDTSSSASSSMSDSLPSNPSVSLLRNSSRSLSSNPTISSKTTKSSDSTHSEVLTTIDTIVDDDNKVK